jgi:hypothetical protein
MKQEFIACKSEQERDAKAPWAVKTIEVCGGYYCFESEIDYDHFVESQKK